MPDGCVVDTVEAVIPGHQKSRCYDSMLLFCGSRRAVDHR